MTDFNVVYTYGLTFDHVIISKVYAVEGTNFLIIDTNGRFKWVPMHSCRLEGFYETDKNSSEDSVGSE